MTIDLCTWDLKAAGKNATCFATLLQNKLKSRVVHFAALFQSCLPTNQVVTVCEELLQKVESTVVVLFATKSLLVACFTGPRQTFFAANDIPPVYGVTPV